MRLVVNRARLNAHKIAAMESRAAFNHIELLLLSDAVNKKNHEKTMGKIGARSSKIKINDFLL